jgi:hypothetical protein
MRSTALALLLAASFAGCAEYTPPSAFQALRTRYDDPSVITREDAQLGLQAFLFFTLEPAAEPPAPPLLAAQVTLILHNPFPEAFELDPRAVKLLDDEGRAYAPAGELSESVAVKPETATRVAWSFTMEPEAAPGDAGSYRFQWKLRAPAAQKETAAETKFLSNRVEYVRVPVAPVYHPWPQPYPWY